MEIKVSLATVDNLRIRMSGLVAGLAILFFSCARKPDLPVTVESRDKIQQIINKGELLNSFVKSEETYRFTFENEELHIPLREINHIQSDSTKWKTIVVFSDQFQIEIPSKGSSLDFIVETVKLNPSGYNPLAASVLVNLPTFGRVKVTVRGKAGSAADISHLCHTQTPSQSVPLFGLYPDFDNEVVLTYTDKDGKERGSTSIRIKTDKLPANFPMPHLVSSVPSKMEPGVNLVNYLGESAIDLSKPYMVDASGDIRWVLLLNSSPELNRLAADIGFHRTKKGTLIAGDVSLPRIVELDMFGNLLRQWDLTQFGYTFHHDIYEMENGHLLITVSKTNARRNSGVPRINDIIIEFDPEKNQIIKEWDLANIVDSARILAPDGETPVQFAQNPTNWVHNNSITRMGNHLLGTMRYQGIFSFTESGSLRWLISPHKYWHEKFKPYLLTPVDENGQVITDEEVISGDKAIPGFDWSWGPHTPVVLSADRLLVFDNGYNRHWVPNWEPGRVNYSRVVEYEVNMEQKTVQQVWSYGQERGASCFAPAMSGVQLLQQTGHVLFCPGINVPVKNGGGGRIVELDPLTKEVVFELEISVSGAMAFQRVQRLPLYPENL